MSDEEDNVEAFLTKAMWQSIGGFESGAFAGTRGWGPNEAGEDVAKLVTAADGDGDGFIDYAEFRGAVVNAVSSLS